MYVISEKRCEFAEDRRRPVDNERRKDENKLVCSTKQGRKKDENTPDVTWEQGESALVAGRNAGRDAGRNVRRNAVWSAWRSNMGNPGAAAHSLHLARTVIVVVVIRNIFLWMIVTFLKWWNNKNSWKNDYIDIEIDILA